MGRDLVFTLPFFQKATMKTHGITITIRAKKPKNVGNCESAANRNVALSDPSARQAERDGRVDSLSRQNAGADDRIQAG